MKTYSITQEEDNYSKDEINGFSDNKIVNVVRSKRTSTKQILMRRRRIKKIENPPIEWHES